MDIVTNLLQYYRAVKTQEPYNLLYANNMTVFKNIFRVFQGQEKILDLEQLIIQLFSLNTHIKTIGAWRAIKSNYHFIYSKFVYIA